MVATPMVHNRSNGKKQGSIDNKTAVIKVEEPGGDVRVFNAEHYIKSDDSTISIYEGARSDGIDYQAHVERCTIDRVDTHEDDTGDGGDEEHRLVTDGGRRIVAPIVGRNPDRRDTGNSHWCESRCKTVYCGRLECPYCEVSDDDQELVTDGGRNVIEPGDYVIHEYPAANVPDLWQVTGVHHYDGVNVDDIPDCEPAPLNDVPAYTVYNLRTQDGEHYTAAVHEDDVERAQTGAMDIIIEDEDDDQELVTDGGRELVSGDDVVHAGEQCRVARCDPHRRQGRC